MLKISMSLALILICARASAQLPMAVAVLGAGTAGNWITEIEMANPTGEILQVQLSAFATTYDYACPGSCSDYHSFIPPNGTLAVLDSWVRDAPQSALHVIYVSSPDPNVLPVIRARARNTLNPQLTTELPVSRLGTITGLAATTLNFPSAIRTADTHVNLVIASIVPDGGEPAFAARVEAFASDGTPLGNMNVTNDSGTGYSPNIFLVDVLAQLGVTSLTDGQIRVTKLSGDGALWGGMAVVYPAGVVALSPGINP